MSDKINNSEHSHPESEPKTNPSSIEVVSGPSQGRDSETQEKLQRIRKDLEDERKIRDKRNKGILLTHEETARLRAIEMQQEENRKREQAEGEKQTEEDTTTENKNNGKESISDREKRDWKKTQDLFWKQLGREGPASEESEESEERKEVEIAPEEVSQKDEIKDIEEERTLMDEEVSEEEAEEIASARGWDWVNNLEDSSVTETSESVVEQPQEERQERTEEESLETEIDARRAERKRTIFKIVSKVAGVGGAILGAKGGYIAAGAITAAYGPIGLAGVVVAGGFLFIKRKSIGSFLSRVMDRTIQELEDEMTADDDPAIKRRLENNKIAKEVLTSLFTGVSGGAGAGLIFGGFSNLSNVVSDVYPSETPSGTEINDLADVPEGQILPETESIMNFGELESSAHMVEQLGLNPDVVNQAMQEGRLLGENLLLEGGTIADPQGMFVDMINHADLTSIDLSTPENTKNFLEGIYEINRQVLSGNQIGEGFVKDVASKTIENFQGITN